jgi:hypothetical protein
VRAILVSIRPCVPETLLKRRLVARTMLTVPAFRLQVPCLETLRLTKQLEQTAKFVSFKLDGLVSFLTTQLPPAAVNLGLMAQMRPLTAPVHQNALGGRATPKAQGANIALGDHIIRFRPKNLECRQSLCQSHAVRLSRSAVSSAESRVSISTVSQMLVNVRANADTAFARFGSNSPRRTS